MMKVTNLRLDEKMLEDSELISTYEQNDRTATIRKLLNKAISKEKLDYSIKLYQEGKISIGRVAELEFLDIWSFHDELNRLGISHPSTLSEFENDLELIKTLKKRYKKPIKYRNG